MDPNEIRQKREAQMEVVRREMARKSLDIIRVYNPLDIKFTFKYDGYPQYVPAKSYKDFPRYLATHYFKKIADYMIGQQVMAKGEELKAVREKQFGKTFWDKYEENTEVWNKVPRMDDENLRKEIYKRVIIGLVEEYGYDMEADVQEPVKPVDFRSHDDQLFDTVKRVSDEQSQKPVKKSVTAEEISVE